MSNENENDDFMAGFNSAAQGAKGAQGPAPEPTPDPALDPPEGARDNGIKPAWEPVEVGDE